MSSKYYENCEDALSGTQGELLEVLLQLGDDYYPWNPAEPEAEVYFADLEREFSLSDCQDEAQIESCSQGLFDKLHQCWASLSESNDTLNQSLAQRFASFVPQRWLEAIANQARTVVSINLSLADQLVLCVKPLLPSWTDEDLLVLARPLAYAMRGTAAPSRSAEWTELSQMEQVRLSLAVAHSALAQLKDTSDNLDSL
ncbi:hypothetical protein AVDCRST_MAG92-3563 [uncultured Coleofasciculus sp.]|uniref:Uncharacterized protein n=1 Tax=uncultured Coleofasciculus sp. TaxID=1267456 RepID=A0A6J4JL85_9CYAN|nr:hypothetical protein AVDCRST_MAG92-3563 [uncultured Coleofasciculus sp.]